MIPEFVGRVPVVATLHDLDQKALVEILTRPKNALVKQYQKLFEYENVKLRFDDDALEAIADGAIKRNVGARGLRIILEELMLDLMYQLPQQTRPEGINHHEGNGDEQGNPAAVRKGGIEDARTGSHMNEHQR